MMVARGMLHVGCTRAATGLSKQDFKFRVGDGGRRDFWVNATRRDVGVDQGFYLLSHTEKVQRGIAI